MTTDPRSPLPVPQSPFPQTELLCIGNAMVDVFAKFDPAGLDRFGLTEPVQHIDRKQVELIQQELEKNAAPLLVSGGGAANTAKIAAMLGLSTAFAGCVGADPLADRFERDLREAGVLPLLTRGKEKTGTCLMLNSGAKLRIAAVPGAALELTEADVQEDWISAAGAVVLDGYMLDRRPLVRRILQLADKHGVPVALDAASVFHIREKTEEVLHYSRNYPLILFMNADESIVFYNTIKKTEEEAERLSEREKEALILQEICPVLKLLTEGELFPIIVIKLGGRGALVLAGGTVYHEETFTILKPKDAIGAGDAFCAAFLAAWIRDKSLSECAAMGNKVARRILEVPGTGIRKERFKSFAKLLRAGGAN